MHLFYLAEGQVSGQMRPGVPDETFTFHPYSGTGTVFQQPSMEVRVANYMVVPGGTTFEVLEANTFVPSHRP